MEGRNMNYKIMVSISVAILFAGSAMALSDDFSSYTNNITVLDETRMQGWTPAYDTSIIARSSLMKNDGLSFVAHANPLLTIENRASVSKNIPAKNITRLMNGGKLYAWFKPSNVMSFSSVKLRVGNDSSNYFEYTNSLPFGVNY